MRNAVRPAGTPAERQLAGIRQYAASAVANMARLTVQTIILKTFLQRMQLLPKPETKSIGIVKIVGTTPPIRTVRIALS